MRKYLCMLGIIFLLGCGSEATDRADWEPTLYETVNNLEGVTMVVKKGSISSTGLTVTFKNSSDRHCVFGEDFLLEKEIEGSWYQVPITLDENYGFNAIGYDLAPSEVKEWTVDWDWLYGNLDTGKYRIIKEMLDYRDTGDYGKYHLANEFNID